MAQKAEVTYDPDVVTPETIRDMIEDMGFDAEILEGRAKGGIETVTLTVSPNTVPTKLEHSCVHFYVQLACTLVTYFCTL